MDKVTIDFANMAATIVERVILSTPGPDSPLYWIMLGTLLALLALLVIWLAIRLRRARKAGEQPVKKDTPEITFDDVTAQAAADMPAGHAQDGGAQGEVASDMAAGLAPDEVPQPAAGFKFFKKSARGEAGSAKAADPEDDVFLLGLEQEMLATRQLYLDGLISKEVYVMETRALYDKAQTRMT